MVLTPQEFEAEITRLTTPINGQFPRPWMTDLVDPQDALLFIVGRNQATPYPKNKLTHQRHVNALFNRAGESCDKLYKEMSQGTPTRGNSHLLRRFLEEEGVDAILETNVVCYSTPKSSHLRDPKHKGGRERGERIFEYLLKAVPPRVLIVHGKETRRDLMRLLKKDLPLTPAESGAPQPANINGIKVFVIPSLAPPQWNKWCRWAEEYLREIAKAAARELGLNVDGSIVKRR